MTKLSTRTSDALRRSFAPSGLPPGRVSLPEARQWSRRSADTAMTMSAEVMGADFAGPEPGGRSEPCGPSHCPLPNGARTVNA